MSCLIGPLFVYWCSDTLLNQRWIFLKSQQEYPDAPWQYTLAILEGENSEIVALPLQARTTFYVIDKENAKSYALILQPDEQQPLYISEPLRVIFAQHIGQYNPIPYAEFWKGSAQSYWIMSQQHRSRLLTDLYSEQFRPLSDFESLEVPNIQYPKTEQAAPSESLSIHQVIEALTVQSWLVCPALPQTLKTGCLYFVLEGTDSITITIEFYPGVRLHRQLSSLEIASDTVLRILDESSHDEIGLELEVFESLEDDGSINSRERFLSAGSSTSLTEFNAALLEPQLASSFRQVWPVEEGFAFTPEEAITASSFETDFELSVSDDLPSRLVKLQQLVWGLSSADRHTLISVLAPEWLLDDPDFLRLSQKEQHVALAYLLKRTKPQDELPLFMNKHSQQEYCAQKPHIDYLTYDQSKPMELIYTDMLGRTEPWQLKAPLETRPDLTLVASSTTIVSQYYKVSESFLKSCLLQPSASRPFPRDFHVHIDNFIHQYLMPSGVAALFLRQWSSIEHSPCVGLIDTYYQYLLLYSLRYTGYLAPFNRNTLNVLTATQKVYQLQQHFGVERLIYPGLSQRGQELYQQIMGAIYNPTGLRDQSSATLDAIETACLMILERRTAQDADLLEATNDVVAAVNASEEPSLDDEENDEPITQQSRAQNVFEDHLHNVVAHIVKYRFFQQLEAQMRQRYSQADYAKFAQPVVTLFFEMNESYRNQHLAVNYRLYPIWLNLLQSCHQLINEQCGLASQPLLHGYLIARSELARSYISQYPSFFYTRIGLNNGAWDGPSVLTMSAILQQQKGNLLLENYSSGLSENFKKAMSSSGVFLPFFRRMLYKIEKNRSEFEDVYQRLFDDSLLDINFFTREDQQFYQALLGYLKISYDFYHSCTQQNTFEKQVQDNLANYLTHIEPLLPMLSKADLVDNAELQFFRGYKEKERKYPIPVSVLRIMKKALEPMADEPETEIDFFKIVFHNKLIEQIKRVQEERAQALIAELQQPERESLDSSCLRQYCYDISQIDFVFVQKVLIYADASELKEIVEHFIAQNQNDRAAALGLKRIKSFLDLLSSLQGCHARRAAESDYHQLLDMFVGEAFSAAQSVKIMTERDLEFFCLSEKLLNKVDALVAVIMATQTYRSEHLAEPATAWLELFMKALVSRLEILSENKLENLKNILEEELSEVELAVIEEHLSDVISWDKYRLLDMLSLLPIKYFDNLRSCVTSSLHIWRHDIKQELGDYTEIMLILNALPHVKNVISGTADIQRELSILIKNFSSETSELPPSNYNWVANLFSTMVTQIEELSVCRQVMSAVKSINAAYQARSLLELPEPFDNSLQSSAITIYMDTGHAITENSEAFMLRTVWGLAAYQQVAISQKSCQMLADSFTRGGLRTLEKNISARWSQVSDLSENALLKWLSVFQQDARAFPIIYPYLLQLSSVKNGKINLWTIFEKLQWNKNFCHAMLQAKRYQCQGENTVRPLKSSLKYLTLKHGGVEIELDEVLQLLGGQKGFASFAQLLQRQRLIFLSEWVPGLMSHISSELDSWLKTKEDLVCGVYFLGFHNIDALCGSDVVKKQTYLDRYIDLIL